jgi:hypothetical protein
VVLAVRDQRTKLEPDVAGRFEQLVGDDGRVLAVDRGDRLAGRRTPPASNVNGRERGQRERRRGARSPWGGSAPGKGVRVELVALAVDDERFR